MKKIISETTVRICPVRDFPCPHGMGCPYVSGYDCSDPVFTASTARPATPPFPGAKP